MGAHLEVVVDRATCQGYGNCLAAAPGAFDLDESDVAVPIAASFDASWRERLEQAARRCPVGAITLIERG